jgi:hypothetical protein
MTRVLTLQELARALGGEICGAQVLAPGPGHSRKDRSLSVWLDASAPEGFACHSHAGDNWQTCRDHVRAMLNLPAFNRRDIRPYKRTHNAVPNGCPTLPNAWGETPPITPYTVGRPGWALGASGHPTGDPQALCGLT